ncbi:MAP6 domain-containing protein 1 [Lagopus leucura]|uniref:MAP6 domain-containing protein 1 n=1 Tax=Lagopus leucura TaxID=30410 RepID=UPI001C663D86|nr:MAP6 domain-containing protein 1 [Lagopus leucura]
MAWPCISRVCCLARFWSQLDRSDLAVPLTIRNYSDIEGHRATAPPPAPTRAVRALPGIGRPERRPRADGGPTTSYRQEYRPWTGAKPSKPIKTKQGFIIPDDHFVQETSYKADYKQIPEVKTRFSPNPSAVFQAPSRILNV